MEKDSAKVAHGRQLKAAMARKGYDRERIALRLGVKVRTITNWTSGATMPTLTERETLRLLLGPYDMDGDPVETALAESALTEDRRYEVLAVYKRKLREQREERAG